jgi:hypothetical protein
MLEVIKAIVNRYKDFDINAVRPNGTGLTGEFSRLFHDSNFEYRLGLHIATLHKQLDVAEYLANVDKINLRPLSTNGLLPLHFLCEHLYNDVELPQAIRIMKMLLAPAPSDVNNVSLHGMTPIFSAVTEGKH